MFGGYDFISRTFLAIGVAFLGHSTDYKRFVLLTGTGILNSVELYLVEFNEPCSLKSIDAVRKYTLWWALLSNVFGLLVLVLPGDDVTVGSLAWTYASVTGMLLLMCCAWHRRSSWAAQDENYNVDHNNAGYGTMQSH
jgi:hypothetical protein